MKVDPPVSPHYRAALKVTKRLHEAGFETYFAGGAVRDVIMGCPSLDWDIATAATPEQVGSLFSRTIPVGRAFGVVIVRLEGFNFEVATFRADGKYLDGRRPERVYYTSPREDVERRDFTINGLLLDPKTQEVIDYVGGLGDLKRGCLRAIGDPVRRFQEDKLRMLRAVRFAARFGFTIEQRTYEALCAGATEINMVSMERIQHELQRMLTGPAPVVALELLDCTGLLEQLLPEISALKGVSQNPLYHPEGDVFTHTMKALALGEPPLPAPLAWALLFHDVGKKSAWDDKKGRVTFYEHEKIGAAITKEVLDRLKVSRAFRDDVCSLVGGHMKLANAEKLRKATLKRLVAQELEGEYDSGLTWFDLLLELNRLDSLASRGDLTDYLAAKRRVEEFAAEPQLPPPLITGRDLIALGLKPGPPFKGLLSRAMDAQLEGTISTREEALELVRRLVGEQPKNHLGG